VPSIAVVGSDGSSGAAAEALPTPKVYKASVFPSAPLPPELVTAIQGAEAALGTPVLLFLQSSRSGHLDTITHRLFEEMLASLPSIPEKPISVIVHSPGGQARAAYQIASLLRHRCREFQVVVPRYAKSAATLFSLGASRIVLGRFAELGPLDAQYDDPDREEQLSALDEVQALERLHAASLEAFDRTILFLAQRSGKKIETLIEPCFSFVAQFMRPLLEKIDAVHYTQISRTLRVAEEYALRLLQPKYSKDEARDIASRLVQVYPDHGFVIDVEEATRLGLKAECMSEPVAAALSPLLPILGKATIIGVLQEVSDEP
jgi:hypothetical protein